jgi:hypothetical protein
MVYRNAGKALKGDSEARWTLAYQLGTAAMIGGMGGMPMDLPKLAALATQPITGLSSSDYDDKFRRTLADILPQAAVNAIMDGLPGLMGPLGPSLGHRMGYDSGIINSEPKDGDDGLETFVMKNIVGASGSMMNDWHNAATALFEGDYQKAFEKALPGSLKDLAKAYRLGTEGVTTKGGQTIRDASFADALLQTLGFSGVERERQTEGHYKLEEAIKNQPKTVAEQLKEKHRQRAGQTVLGQPVTTKNRAITQEYGNAYE